MKKRLKKRIEIMKEKLYKLIDLYGTQNNEVLKCSQELDILIYNAYTMTKSK